MCVCLCVFFLFLFFFLLLVCLFVCFWFVNSTILFEANCCDEQLYYQILNPRPSKRGVATPVIFPDNYFGQPKVAKRLYVIYTNPITYLSTNMNRNGVVVWLGGVVKFSRGLVKLRDSYFDYS